MDAKIILKDSKSIMIEFELPISSSMLKTEEDIQKVLNKAGALATAHALSTFDTDGEAILKGKTKYTSKGKVSKK